MQIESFIQRLNADFFTGVPDSQLKPLCDFLYHTYGMDSKHHVIAANEGNAAAIAAGYYLSTGKTPVVYLQNSGLGNLVNPLASLLNEKVYGIPCLFVVGWRGEPGVHDEPQHIFQGEITLGQLDLLGIPAFILEKDTSENQLHGALRDFCSLFAQGRQAAIVVRKGALTYDCKPAYGNPFPMTREMAIRHILQAAEEDVVVSTTGKASRELFETREGWKQRHSRDFLTVGSMGHSSSIALGIALQRPERRIWCLDGDGAALMHLGAMAIIGECKPANLIHVVLNNQAHESVGGMPTAAGQIDLRGIAQACGYPFALSAASPEELTARLNQAKITRQLCFLEVTCALGARSDLGRPTTTPQENKRALMKYLGVHP